MSLILKISPRFDSTKLTDAQFDDRVDVYEDRVRGWLINCGHILNEHEHAGFGVLQVGLAYFEGFAVFWRGEDSDRKSEEFFKDGLVRVFPEVEGWPPQVKSDFASAMFRDGRCGLFHLGVARSRVVLSDGEPVFRLEAVDAQSNPIIRVHIDRKLFIQRIDEHLSSFVALLRDPQQTERHRNFEAAWTLVHS